MKQRSVFATGCLRRVQKNDRTMANTLASTAWAKGMDWCCGIHGAARNRRGIKHAISAARRRHDQQVIAEELAT